MGGQLGGGPTASPGTITRLLRRCGAGDESAQEALYALVYNELRWIARARVREMAGAGRLQPTEVVNEAYLRLQEVDRRLTWQDRKHFFRLASTIMRNVLVDHAREQSAGKRGGGQVAVDLDVAASSEAPSLDVDILALDQALRRLQSVHQRPAEVVEHWYFAGLRPSEIASLLGISRAAVYRDLKLAKAWLARELATE